MAFRTGKVGYAETRRAQPSLRYDSSLCRPSYSIFDFSASEYMTDEATEEVVNLYHDALNSFPANPDKVNEFNILWALKLATAVFMPDYYLLWGASLLETMVEYHRPKHPEWFECREFYRDLRTFEFKPPQARAVLICFFDRIKDVRRQSTQRGRLLPSLTIVRLLGQFQNMTIIRSVVKRTGWFMKMKLDGTWLGWMLKRPKFFTEKQSDLVILLCELLIYNIFEESTKNIWESHGEVYFYGTDISDGTKVLSEAIINIRVQSTSRRLCLLFQRAFEREAGRFKWPKNLPRQKFRMDIDIDCPKAVAMGCSRVLELRTFPCIERGKVERPRDGEIDVVDTDIYDF